MHNGICRKIKTVKKDMYSGQGSHSGWGRNCSVSSEKEKGKEGQTNIIIIRNMSDNMLALQLLLFTAVTPVWY